MAGAGARARRAVLQLLPRQAAIRLPAFAGLFDGRHRFLIKQKSATTVTFEHFESFSGILGESHLHEMRYTAARACGCATDADSWCSVPRAPPLQSLRSSAGVREHEHRAEGARRAQIEHGQNLTPSLVLPEAGVLLPEDGSAAGHAHCFSKCCKSCSLLARRP